MAYINETRYIVAGGNGRQYGGITRSLEKARELLADATKEFPNEKWEICWFMD